MAENDGVVLPETVTEILTVFSEKLGASSNINRLEAEKIGRLIQDGMVPTSDMIEEVLSLSQGD